MSDQVNWVDNKFAQRLQSRAVQPGVVRLKMGYDVVSRVERMAKPQLLVQALGQRWQSVLANQVDQLPFVYAQPPQSELETAVSAISGSGQTSSPQQSTNRNVPELPLAQGKRPPPTTAATPRKAPQSQLASGSTPKKTAVSKPSPPTLTQPPTALKKQPQASGQSTTSPSNDSQTAAVVTTQTAPTPAMAESPLPVVAVQKVTAVPASATQTAEASSMPKAPRAKAKGTAVSQTESANSPKIVVVASQTAAPPAPTMPITAAVASRKLADAATAVNKPQMKMQKSEATSPHPLVKPRPATPKTTPTFPSATAAGNGRFQTAFSTTNPLPVVRSTPEQSSKPPSALPLPKTPSTTSSAQTAIATPSSPASTTPFATPASASGIIQRAPQEETLGTSATEQESVDMSEIVAEVERRFRRELAVEGERRGATSWY